MSKTVRAAGGVVLRRGGPAGARVAVVHRPRYDDWSLPKGKLDPGEGWEEAALREVWEETGLRCRLVEELGGVEYRDDKGRRKQVRYWLMEPEGETGSVHPDGDEVDELRWCEPQEAIALLTYERDRGLVREAIER